LDSTLELITPIKKPSLLGKYRSGQNLTLQGSLIVGRDQAHKRMIALLEEGKSLPFDPEGAVIYYMGPSPAPPGKVIGAAGPTTSGRMDNLTIPLLKQGVKALLGKGRRAPVVKEALIEHGALYLAAVGGAGAFYGSLIKSVKVLAWPELGPEALLSLEIIDFPVLVINDLYGGDLYALGPDKWKKVLGGEV
jgi:fumarate hydratase subunit beta